MKFNFSSAETANCLSRHTVIFSEIHLKYAYRFRLVELIANVVDTHIKLFSSVVIANYLRT